MKIWNKWIACLNAVCLAAAVTGCGQTTEESDESKTAQDTGNISITAGYWGGTCEAPIFIAYENGYFEAFGLDVNLLQITQDVSILMANDELDCFELTPDQFMPIKNGVEVTIIDSLHKGCIQGAATKESGILSVSDLEGKTVAVASMGDIAKILISSEMVQRGKDPDLVNWVVYPGSEMELALENGSIDAFGAYDPYAEIAEKDGYVKFFSNLTDEELADYLCCFVGLSTATLEENPEIAVRLSKAFRMATEYLESNPQEAAEKIMEKGYIAGDAAINAKLIDDYEWISGDEELLFDSAKEIWHQVYRAGALDETVAESQLNEWIDTMVDSMVKYYGE
ncbi:MAG: ABC transporter substrate-binding protein [Ruminococcus sp.]